MEQAELDSYRQKLVDLGKRLDGEFSFLQSEALRQTGGEASGNLSNTPMHLADLGTDSYEQEISLGLLENEGHLQEEISGAMDRINAGTYGCCEQCGQDIGKMRLNALPYARLCVQCARQAEETPANQQT